MKICVVKDENGISVGIEPENVQEVMGEADYLEPVGDEMEALMRVKDLLASNPQEDAQGEADFEEGYESGKGMDLAAMNSERMR